jgi:PhzF family phenazine biosynthesis protein
VTDLPIFQIDAFTRGVFSGNPAAVCPLESWLDDATMQAIAAENNLAETAFFVPEGDGYALRWFTPVVEVDLCGHATLASAYVVFEHLKPGSRSVTFQSHSGPLTVTREGDLLTMDFPAWRGEAVEAPAALIDGIGVEPVDVRRTRDIMAVLRTQEEVEAVRPDLAQLGLIDHLGIIVTAPGREVDFVSRFFSPRGGIPEDPVTGSAHCTLAPYWAERLGKSRLTARQLSPRGGELLCDVDRDRVRISGHCAPYLEGVIHVP